MTCNSLSPLPSSAFPTTSPRVRLRVRTHILFAHSFPTPYSFQGSRLLKSAASSSLTSKIFFSVFQLHPSQLLFLALSSHKPLLSCQIQSPLSRLRFIQTLCHIWRHGCSWISRKFVNITQGAPLGTSDSVYPGQHGPASSIRPGTSPANLLSFLSSLPWERLQLSSRSPGLEGLEAS